MINVLYVIWSLGLGGAEQVVISLAKGLDRNKFKPFVCCLNDEGRFAEEVKKEGIQVIALNKAKGIDFSLISKMVRVIKENNIQIIHTHLWGANFWGRFAASAAKVPVVVTEHNVDVWKSSLHFMIDRFLFRKTDCFIAVSETVRNFYAQKLGIEKEEIRVVYNGVDTTMSQGHNVTRSQVKASLGVKEDEKVIAVIGRLVPQKGMAFFLEALREMFNANLRESNANGRGLDKIKVLIVGEGPLLESHKSQVASHKLNDKVKFLGFRKDIQEILSITDILVLPSSREGLPMILLEAMGAGAIVIATRVGGTPELVQDGVNGYLVEYGDISGLREKLEDILSTVNGSQTIEKTTMDDGRWTKDEGRKDETRETKDEGRKDETRETKDEGREDEKDLSLKKIRENARKTVEERFSLKKMVEEHEGIYDQLIG
jgi:glycosyltransferase involved in cell wall biosynthesis